MPRRVMEAGPSLTTYRTNSAENAPEGPRELLQSLTKQFGGAWEVRWDSRANRPHLIQGPGIPLVPGTGNQLTYDAIGLAPPLRLEDLESRARRLLADNPWMLKLPNGDEWVSLPDESTGSADSSFWILALRHVHEGVPVSGARIFVRVAQGNVVQIGSSRVADVVATSKAGITADEALDAALAMVGGSRERIEENDAPELRLFPALPLDGVVGRPYAGPPGRGYAHQLAWERRFRLKDDPVSYRVRVDAASAEVLDVFDLTMEDTASGNWGRVMGGIFPNTRTDAQVNTNLPHLRINDVLTSSPEGSTTPPSRLTSTFTDAAGFYRFYPLFGSCRPLSDRCDNPNAQLIGRYIQVTDRCGEARRYTNPFVGSDGVEVIDFGTNSGINCETPGVGGLGNTAAARNVYYHLTRINRTVAEMDDVMLPANTRSWLNRSTLAIVHPSAVCNAQWNGWSFEFFRSDGATCADSGQVSDVIFHEWGHGLDTNIGIGAPQEKASGEAFGDTTAFLQNREGCIGEKYRLPGTPTNTCGNCRSSCRDGLRDVEAFTIDSGRPARPDSISREGQPDGTYPEPWLLGPKCDLRRPCPFVDSRGLPYAGPMGYEGHCESYIASTANWDTRVQISRARGSDEAGWEAFRKIWFNAMPQLGSAYDVVVGEECNSQATVDGCVESNWYTVFVAIDEAVNGGDGNVSNGTPNLCSIWTAFDAHGIACGGRPNTCPK